MRGALSAAQRERIHLQFEMSTFFLSVWIHKQFYTGKPFWGEFCYILATELRPLQSNSFGSKVLEHSLPLKNRHSTRAQTQPTNAAWQQMAQMIQWVTSNPALSLLVHEEISESI